MTRRCRNTLGTPSSFSLEDMSRSAREPEGGIMREHVFGLNATSLVSSSECLHTYPSSEYDSGGEAIDFDEWRDWFERRVCE